MSKRFWTWLGVTVFVCCGAGVGGLLGLNAGSTGVFIGAAVGAFCGLFIGGLCVAIGEQEERHNG